MTNKVFGTGFDVLNKVREAQQEQLDQAVKLAADCLLVHKTLYVTGSDHSHTLCEEFYGCVGGLVLVIPTMISELTTTEHPIKSSFLERLSGYAATLADLCDVEEGDVVLIASSSGRNAYPIEMATEARKRGVSVIAVTNIVHSNAVSSRHESGEMLIDIVNIAIDNCGVPGDCAVQMEGIAAAVYPALSMANAFIAQAVSAQCTYCIKEKGVTPPAFISLNSEGTEHVNDGYLERCMRMYKKVRL